MKILIFGAGVIGTAYGWQLWEAGYDVSLLVRKQRVVRYSNSGINISCTDLRGKEKEYKKTVFRPRIVDRLNPEEGYDLIIVSVKNYQLRDAVPYLAKYSGKADILFLGHFWQENEWIEETLPKDKYFFGFPGMVLGAKTLDGINCYFFGNSNTFLGEPDGKVSQRLLDTRKMMELAGMQPRQLHAIESWIRGDFAWQAAILGPVLKAGNFRLFAEDKKLLGQAIQAIREVNGIVQRSGIKVNGAFPFWLFRLPAFLVVPLLKKSFNQTMQAALEANLKHSLEEIRGQYMTLLALGKKNNEKMVYLASFEKYLEKEEK
ncbi:MAG: 2-dehydropantoate 2-reductase N-terminal domain-containing protein [Bacteroides sp.]|jgi:2-dehydropantoate 2-reductase|nr:2-dehydropantoate 2-reductase N-terminal domain-containing protein [Bacteroides sp.]